MHKMMCFLFLLLVTLALFSVLDRLTGILFYNGDEVVVAAAGEFTSTRLIDYQFICAMLLAEDLNSLCTMS